MIWLMLIKSVNGLQWPAFKVKSSYFAKYLDISDWVGGTKNGSFLLATKVVSAWQIFWDLPVIKLRIN